MKLIGIITITENFELDKLQMFVIMNLMSFMNVILCSKV